MSLRQTYDVVIVGGGILGLSLARAYKRKYADLSVAVLEKEDHLGAHGSGRNSGVLHSGIYYPPESLKARCSAEGARILKAFCQEHDVPFAQVGKVIVPSRREDDSALDLLNERGRVNGSVAVLIDSKQLKEVEPLAHSATGRAIYVQGSTVVDPAKLVQKMGEVCRREGIDVFLRHWVKGVRPSDKTVEVASDSGTIHLNFGHLVNSGGIFADKLAHACGIGLQYSVMPFKGLYYEMIAEKAPMIRGHIYPVPDLRLPFLGVHFTRGVNGKVYLGPNALPSLGRENYSGTTGMNPVESVAIMGRNLGQYWRNEQGFRLLVHEEVKRLFKSQFVKAAQKLVPSTVSSDLKRSAKVGIRAQLFDNKHRKLVMDFLVEKGPHSTHILNAISPGFTCGPTFAEHVVQTFPL